MMLTVYSILTVYSTLTVYSIFTVYSTLKVYSIFTAYSIHSPKQPLQTDLCNAGKGVSYKGESKLLCYYSHKFRNSNCYCIILIDAF